MYFLSKRTKLVAMVKSAQAEVNYFPSLAYKQDTQSVSHRGHRLDFSRTGEVDKGDVVQPVDKVQETEGASDAPAL